MEKEIILQNENKKLAIVCFGTRISLNSKNVRSVDFTYLREILQNVYGRTVDFVSLKTKKEVDLDYYKSAKDVEFNDYDEVMIYNSTYQPFGGVFKSEAIETFVKLMDFNGELWYCQADPKMPCLDYAAYIKSRLVDGRIKIDQEPGYREITPEFCDEWSKKVYPRIGIAYTGSNYNKYYDVYCDKLTKGGKKEPKPVNVLNPNYKWTFIPLFEYYSVNEDLSDKLKNYDYSSKKYDLIYFGNNRMTERNKIINKIYDRKNYNNYVLGFDPAWKECKYESSGYIKHDEMFKFIPSNAYATVVLGDILHNDNIHTARFFESMLLDVVAFIWHEYDPNKRFVENQELKDFIYINSPEELEEKVAKIKNDEAFYHHIVELERQDIINQFSKFKNA